MEKIRKRTTQGEVRGRQEKHSRRTSERYVRRKMVWR